LLRLDCFAALAMTAPNRFHDRIKSGGRLFWIVAFLVEHDLFGKPVSTFPDHALLLRLDCFAAATMAADAL